MSARPDHDLQRSGALPGELMIWILIISELAVFSAGLLALLALNSGLSSADLLQALVWDLSRHAGGHEFPDDVSALIFDYRGE